MLSATDTFIEYLSTGLAGVIAVHWVHFDANDATSNLLHEDALNVTILGVQRDGSEILALISLDILGHDERASLTALQATLGLLAQEQTIQELSYADNPASPTPVAGKHVFWEGRDIKFKAIPVENYLHYNATFPIRHSAF